MTKVLIDLEFTGLDNSYTTDNEIIQVKVYNLDKNIGILRNFNSKKQLSAYTQLEHKVKRYEDQNLFCKSELLEMMNVIEADLDCEFYGFGVDQDKSMLSKYDINQPIIDIRTHYQMSNVARRMATEGSGLEPTYLIVTGNYPAQVSHASFSEMLLIEELYRKMESFKANEIMQIVPHGHCSGMAITDYVIENRRQADGYRFNNYDLFAIALDNAIIGVEEGDSGY